MAAMDRSTQQWQKWQSQRPSKNNPTKLFIGGITRNTTTKTLHDHFVAYGAVLDSVAMRMADGRPRGFGYVTLDSSAAADRVLAEPQVIDGRVVDIKRAVPDTQGSASKNSVSKKAEAAKLEKAAEEFRMPSSACHPCPWLDAMPQYHFPAAGLMSTIPATPPGEFVLSTPVVADGRKKTILGTDACRIKESRLLAPTLSAGAPVFVPQSVVDSTGRDTRGASESDAQRDSADSDEGAQKILAYSVLPGLPPIEATALPPPLSLPSNCSQLEQGFTTIPTSLPPGLELWQPDEEVSPVCGAPCKLSAPSTPLSLGQPSPTSSTSLLLSTMPRQQQAEAPAKLNTDDLELKGGFESTVTTPAADTIMKVVLPSEDSRAPAFLKMCTMGTQTEREKELLCDKCQDSAFSGLAAKQMAAQGGA